MDALLHEFDDLELQEPTVSFIPSSTDPFIQPLFLFLRHLHPFSQVAIASTDMCL